MTVGVYRLDSTESDGGARPYPHMDGSRETLAHELPPSRGPLMPRLVLAGLSSEVKMGQQVYEEAIAERAQRALGDSWRVSRTSVRTLRSPLAGTARIPATILSAGRPKIRKGFGRALYGRSDLVHRFDLRLPPARKEVVMIHDVVSWRFPDEAVPPSSAIAEARAARAVVCPSQFSADEVSEVLGVSDAIAIPNGVGPEAFGAVALSDAELEQLGLRPPFVLHTGGCTLRKNLGALAAAWPLVRRAAPDAHLALVGPPDGRRTELFEGVAGAVLLGRLEDEVLHRLRAAAACVVVPSLYEGFGLPALEGMAAGVPVIAARRSSLPEVCGDAATLVEPTADGLAEGMLLALDRGADIEALVARGRVLARAYTWERSAAAHADVWRRVVGS